MTHSRTHCVPTLAGASPSPASRALALAACLIIFLTPLAKAQTAAAQSPPLPALAMPPSEVRQTAPAPEAPPEKIAPAVTPEGSVGPTSAEAEITAFDIAVRAPPGVRELLERHLELQRYRAVTDLDEVELARLIVLAEGNVRNLVGTLGYFSPEIRITREGGLNERPTIVVAVTPGPATEVGAVTFSFAGDIADSPDGDAITQRTAIDRKSVV